MWIRFDVEGESFEAKVSKDAEVVIAKAWEFSEDEVDEVTEVGVNLVGGKVRRLVVRVRGGVMVIHDDEAIFFKDGDEVGKTIWTSVEIRRWNNG